MNTPKNRHAEPKERDPDGPVISVQEIHNAVREAMVALDELWPDDERFGPPRKVHIVELLDSVKLRLIQRADANLNKYVSPFEKAANKLLGPAPANPADPASAASPGGKSSMQVAMEEARGRISRNSRS